MDHGSVSYLVPKTARVPKEEIFVSDKAKSAGILGGSFEHF